MSTEIKFLVPRQGLKIPVPGKRRYLAESGERVRVDTYWRRRIEAQDVTVRPEPQAAEVVDKKSTKPSPKES